MDLATRAVRSFFDGDTLTEYFIAVRNIPVDISLIQVYDNDMGSAVSGVPDVPLAGDGRNSRHDESGTGTGETRTVSGSSVSPVSIIAGLLSGSIVLGVMLAAASGKFKTERNTFDPDLEEAAERHGIDKQILLDGSVALSSSASSSSSSGGDDDDNGKTRPKRTQVWNSRGETGYYQSVRSLVVGFADSLARKHRAWQEKIRSRIKPPSDSSGPTEPRSNNANNDTTNHNVNPIVNNNTMSDASSQQASYASWSITATELWWTPRKQKKDADNPSVASRASPSLGVPKDNEQTLLSLTATKSSSTGTDSGWFDHPELPTRLAQQQPWQPYPSTPPSQLASSGSESSDSASPPRRQHSKSMDFAVFEGPDMLAMTQISVPSSSSTVAAIAQQEPTECNPIEFPSSTDAASTTSSTAALKRVRQRETALEKEGLRPWRKSTTKLKQRTSMASTTTKTKEEEEVNKETEVNEPRKDPDLLEAETPSVPPVAKANDDDGADDKPKHDDEKDGTGDGKIDDPANTKNDNDGKTIPTNDGNDEPNHDDGNDVDPTSNDNVEKSIATDDSNTNDNHVNDKDTKDQAKETAAKTVARF